MWSIPFRGEAFFLSNCFPSPVQLGGVMYRMAEAVFQAAKTTERAQIQACLSPAAARVLGRRVTLRPGWDELRLGVMRAIVAQKFRLSPVADRLLATGDTWLEEGTTQGDRFWGMANGCGENQLGRPVENPWWRFRERYERRKDVTRGEDRSPGAGRA
ncbi:NADAR family protein [Deinococcus multiflagellatus]|uniref:NADAR family protein n=1 Tax=Deinococcus multiflagellatus TaxID=1656887 RepID=A0ABW1ZQ37_9DEIO|nr:NADAR family protein [Deinococcus multiflagellatus]MBZ9715796.1 NADAR family protein [Deinococcus multiflagellatus]